mgnify:CR=1 FL=1
MLKDLNKEINQVEIKVKALSINESFVRASVAGFCLQLNPSIDELTDIKTAVSEAVTNSIVHAYPNKEGDILIKVSIFNDTVKIEVIDYGVGIENVEEAKKPFYTTKPDQERSGMGFTVMESFMDEISVVNNNLGGLKVIMSKKIKEGNSQKIKNFN